MRVALAQINTIIGDFSGNIEKILKAYASAVKAGAEVVVTPELAITGYPPRDLLLKHDFVEQNLKALEQLASRIKDAGLIVGYVGKNENLPGREVTNSVAFLWQGRIVATRTKMLLPTYDVFDEDRYFEPAYENTPVVFKNYKLGLTICEDIWNDEDFWRERRYRRNPAAELIESGAEIIINTSASPWHIGKEKTRRMMLLNLATKFHCPVVYCNLVGGNDELIFDGNSLVVNKNGEIIAVGKMFEEDLIIVDTDTESVTRAEEICDEEKIFRALAMGLRDYVNKCGFKSVVLGLSGGIDSALTAVIATSALGKENVHGLSLPSQFSSRGSLDDARQLAENLGIRYDVISIQPPFEAVKKQLSEVFKGLPEDVTEENIQARLRGVILMAISNKFGSLLLSTGNKSEIGVGYCTLYGDMCGGLDVVGDVPKTMVYKIARWVNREREIIPCSSLTKPPSAELRPNQTDQDTLPPYETLDAILEAYVVEGKSISEIVKMGFDPVTVKKVVKLIKSSEYKRRQAAPVLKVTTKAFGSGRRLPIAQKYIEDI